jgi:two-component system sensor histidine kinase/response regulator
MGETTPRATILAIEDEPAMLELIALLLEEEGHQVLRADSGEAALACLEEHSPDLIVSDVMMPGIDGFGLYEQVHTRADWSRIPFIFLTAKGERSDVRRGMELGADDYLVKPFEPEELLAAVNVRLARANEAKAAMDRVGASLQQKIIQTLTHEFRTPLALVIGYTDLLESSGPDMDEDEFQTTLHGLHSGAQRLMGLVEDFLLVSQLQTGAIASAARQERRRTEEPDQVVRQIMMQYERQAAARNVSLVTDLGARGAVIAAGQRDLEEMVRRLVDNAIKFSKSQGGRISATTRRDGSFWTLEIADRGIGIRQEALSWIFDAFRQVDRDQMEQQGTGIGLNIVRGLAEAYGGHVDVESQPGVGSTFSVWLPLAVD